MANVSNDLSTLDFDSVKSNLKSYLKSQPIFQDYDFDASNINVLLDVLAYNTNLNAFYLNMVANEMFLDSALMRDSIISHAKELNYLPRSFRSAVATVDIYLRDKSDEATVLIPRGTSFTGTAGNRNFTFTNAENILGNSLSQTEVEAQRISYDSAFDYFVAPNVLLYEGDYIQDTFIANYSNPVKYIISNKTVDTNSLIVTVIEDNGATVLQYLKRDTLFELDAQSKVFFIQPSQNDSYEILFGDGVIGRQPKDNAIILIEYRACNGELPNGILKFNPDDDIDTSVVVKINTTAPAAGGAIPESLNSIKLNAPRAFTTQERVITAQDYSTLLKANYSEINDVIAYGGEEYDPPLFGKVIIAVDLKNTDDLPESYKAKYNGFIKPRSPLSIDPLFVKPDYTYVSIKTDVKYNINETSLNIDDIKSLVLSAIQEYNDTNINGFGKTLRYSKLTTAIDQAQVSIISNDTDVLATKFITPILNGTNNYNINFNMALRNDIGQSAGHLGQDVAIVSSSSFVFQDNDSFFEDDGNGNIRILREEGSTHVVVATVGTVNYNTGSISIEGVSFQEVYGGVIRFSVRPRDKDIESQQTSILRVLDSDVQISVKQVRI